MGTTHKLMVRLIHVFKNWKLLFKNICGNTCGWKSVWKCVKCYLKTENNCLKTQTKHPLTCWYYSIENCQFWGRESGLKFGAILN